MSTVRNRVIALLLLLASGCCSAGDSLNTTGTLAEECSNTDIVIPPFPGNWYEKQGDAVPFTLQGRDYPSAYAAMVMEKDYNPVRNFNCWINSFLFSDEVAGRVVEYFDSVELGYYAVSYMRNLFLGAVVYYVTSAIFHYFCYVHPSSEETFRDRERPSTETIVDQIMLAQASMFIYVMLPVLSDWLVEEKFTFCYYTFEEIGGFIPYVVFTCIYFGFVEIGIYWMHRTLHTNKLLYKYIHMKHHKYKHAHTLTPWASIAFNPIDGILQACPYVIVMFFVPCHYLTHIAMLFFTAIWSTYIHDTMDWNIGPIMGSKFHTVHHTHYMYNFGQVFTFCDRYWGTLREPISKTGAGKVIFKGE